MSEDDQASLMEDDQASLMKEIALTQMIVHWHKVYSDALIAGNYALAKSTNNVTIPRAYKIFEEIMGFPYGSNH
jgi:hypothetical protein